MLTIVNILILFFIILIFYQILLANYIIEGLTTEYKPYNEKDVLILAQQNAGNISYLKQQIGNIPSLKNKITDLSNNVTTLQNQVNTLVQANQQYTASMIGTTPPTITGTTS
jgi:hypothetical protein